MTPRHVGKSLLIAFGLAAVAVSPGFPQTRAGVSITFDHVQPPSKTTDSALLFLRLKNNTRAPIQVLATAPQTGAEGVELVHEIVESGSRKQASGWISPPARYSPVNEATTVEVQPHADLLFSVPLNHVGPWWRLRITFGPQPQDTTDFTWADVPPKERSAWKK